MSPATDAVARQAAIERAKEEAGLAESRAILLGVQTLCHLPPADLRLLIAAAEAGERAVAALALIQHIHAERETHLGRPRWSGIEKGCIGCIAAIGRGEWENSTASDFKHALAARKG